MILLKPFPECCPLGLLCHYKRLSEYFDFCGQCCAPPFKGPSNSFGQLGAIKVELPGQQPDVIEILHPAVQYTQFDHGFKLFEIELSRL